jgi:hypothetical protein
VFNQFLDAPLLVVAALAVLVVLITVMVRASSRGTWSRAMRTWRANLRTSTRTGVVIVPAYALALLLQVAVQSWTPIGTLVDVVGASSAWVLPLVSALHAVVLVPVVSWVVVRVVADSGTAPGRSPGPGQPARPRAPVAAVVVTILVVVATGVSAFVFLPLLLVVARLLVAPVAAVGEDLHVRAALQRSNRLVRGHTWRALGILVTAMLLVLASGLPGALLLAFTPLSFVVAGFATALVNVVLVPILALAAASFFGELRDAEPDET